MAPRYFKQTRHRTRSKRRHNRNTRSKSRRNRRSKNRTMRGGWGMAIKLPKLPKHTETSMDNMMGGSWGMPLNPV